MDETWKTRRRWSRGRTHGGTGVPAARANGSVAAWQGAFSTGCPRARSPRQMQRRWAGGGKRGAGSSGSSTGTERTQVRPAPPRSGTSPLSTPHSAPTPYRSPGCRRYRPDDVPESVRFSVAGHVQFSVAIDIARWLWRGRGCWRRGGGGSGWWIRRRCRALGVGGGPLPLSLRVGGAATTVERQPASTC